MVSHVVFTVTSMFHRKFPIPYTLFGLASNHFHPVEPCERMISMVNTSKTNTQHGLLSIQRNLVIINMVDAT
jgi:hypothetical protein